MSEKDVLLRKENENKSTWFDNQFKISLFAAVYAVAYEIRSNTETQFLYDYWKTHSQINISISTEGVGSKSNDRCSNGNETRDSQIQELATTWNWYITAVTYGLALPLLIIIGPISDRKGRKGFLVYNLGLTTLSVGARTYVVYNDMNLYWYLLFCGLEGIAGSSYVYHFCSCTILSDCTKAGNQRPMAFAVYETMFGVGIAGARILTGYLIKLGFCYPYMVATGTYFVGLTLFCCFLQETKYSVGKKGKAKMCEEKLCNVCRNPDFLHNNYSKNTFCANIAVFFLHHFPETAFGSIKLLYTLGTPFCWTSVHIGWYGACTDILQCIICTLILKCLLLCLRDFSITVMGFLSFICGIGLFGVWQTDMMIYIVTAIGTLKNIPNCMLKAILSRMVSPDNLGSLFSVIYLMEGICRLGGSTLFNNIYNETLYIYKGTVFFIMAGVPLLGLSIFICLHFCNSSPTVSIIEVDPPASKQAEYGNGVCGTPTQKGQCEDSQTVQGSSSIQNYHDTQCLYGEVMVPEQNRISNARTD